MRSLPSLGLARSKVRDPHSLRVPRAAMPQFPGRDHLDDFLAYLTTLGVGHHRTEVLAPSLKATQLELSLHKAKRIPFKTGSPVLCSSDNYVLDGHHRWLKWLLRRPDRPMPAVKIDLPIRPLLDIARRFAPPPSPTLVDPAEFASLPRAGRAHTLPSYKGDDPTIYSLRSAIRGRFGPDTRDHVRDVVSALPPDQALSAYRALVKGGRTPATPEEAGAILHRALALVSRYYGEDDVPFPVRFRHWEDGDRHVEGLQALAKPLSVASAVFSSAAVGARQALQGWLDVLTPPDEPALPPDSTRPWGGYGPNRLDLVRSAFNEAMRRAEKSRADAEKIQAVNRIEVQKMLKPRSPFRWDLEWRDSTQGWPACQEAVRFLSAVFGANPDDLEPFRVLVTALPSVKAPRSHLVPLGHHRSRLVIHFNESPAGVCHLLGHAIEHAFPHVRHTVRRFLHHKVRRSRPIAMDVLHGCSSLRGELGRDGDFHLRTTDSPYAGKVAIDHTEVMAMGLEYLYRDCAMFATADPEYCKFVIGVLKGDLR
jgi:hypothetical protein